MKVWELRDKLDKAPAEAEVVLDTSIVLGNFEECLSLDLIVVENEGSLIVLTSVPDKAVPQPVREGSEGFYL